METLTLAEAAKMAGVCSNSLALYMRRQYERKLDIEFGFCFPTTKTRYKYQIYKEGFEKWLDKKRGAVE